MVTIHLIHASINTKANVLKHYGDGGRIYYWNVYFANKFKEMRLVK